MDVKSLCLGVLSLGDSTGYEIKKHFEEAFSHFFAAGYGSIYPALASLTNDGLVECTSITQEKRPDKKVYSITELGRTALLETLLATPPRHKIRSEFFVLLYFADLLPPDRLSEVLAERSNDIEGLLELLDAFEERDCAIPGHRFVIGLGRAALQAQLQYIVENRDALLNALKPAHAAA